ncbi:uncharacterized protein LOC117103770 [Anneissia japonica]|uniref:uncharacterized protein LOC117103770 n=1 Tax=Anneissia japonica TaxID=1529436 RepID=UPI0014257198|nr:uncharacterized protein LOC117103770 [Anneissia japonica]
MSADIREIVDKCQICQTYQDKQKKEPMMSYPIPTRSWEIISQDILTYKSKDYLVTVDHYSDVWFLDELQDLTSKTIIECSKTHFALQGIPSTLITDNGRQWVSREFAEFTKTWEFNHVTSSPYHSQRHSPAQRLLSRRTNTYLPVTEILLQPQVVTGVSEHIKKRKQISKLQYDKSATKLPELVIGETVRLRPENNNQEWQTATCKKKVGPRSYLVETTNGKVYRSNRKFLSTTPAGDIAKTMPTVAPDKSDITSTTDIPVPATPNGTSDKSTVNQQPLTGKQTEVSTPIIPTPAQKNHNYAESIQELCIAKPIDKKKKRENMKP